jgi:hypothetical protein
MGKAAPRKPLATPSEKATESSTSHAARQDKAKTAKIKEEKDTKVKKREGRCRVVYLDHTKSARQRPTLRGSFQLCRRP